jgi:hypothetical protein
MLTYKTGAYTLQISNLDTYTIANMINSIFSQTSMGMHDIVKENDNPILVVVPRSKQAWSFVHSSTNMSSVTYKSFPYSTKELLTYLYDKIESK